MNNKYLLLAFGLLCVVAIGDCKRKLLTDRVHYHVFVGDVVEEEYSITLNVLKNSTFYQVMQIAASKDSDFKFTSIEYTGLGHYINSIGGTEENRELNLYWMIYILDSPPNPNNLPDDANLSPVGVDGLIVENGEYYLFWYKTVIW